MKIEYPTQDSGVWKYVSMGRVCTEQIVQDSAEPFE